MNRLGHESVSAPIPVCRRTLAVTGPMRTGSKNMSSRESRVIADQNPHSDFYAKLHAKPGSLRFFDFLKITVLKIGAAKFDFSRRRWCDNQMTLFVTSTIYIS